MKSTEIKIELKNVKMLCPEFLKSKKKLTNRREKIEFENFTVFFYWKSKKIESKKVKLEVDEDEWRANADRLIQNLQKIKTAAR